MTAPLHPTVKALRRAQRRYERADTRLEQLRNERDHEIRAAIAEGMSHAAIQRALGKAITRTRVGQIAEGRR